MGKYASVVVKQAQDWIGLNEYDGTHMEIVNTYNSINPKLLPRGYRMQRGDSWCAATVSAIAIKNKYTDIIPIECSCGEMVKKAITMGIWVENDAYVASPADFVVYDWDDKYPKKDCKGWPDHIGVIERVANGKYTVIEGNYANEMKRRLLDINGRYIRGFICPRYDLEKIPETDGKLLQEIAKAVVRGDWGNYPERKKRLEAAGYDYAEVQKIVNKLVGK